MLLWIVALTLAGGLDGKPSSDEVWPSIAVDRTWQEYEVRADSFDEALRECRKAGQGGWAGYTKWDLAWNYNFSDFKIETRSLGDKQLLIVRDVKITVTEVKVKQMTRLPKLIAGEGFSDEDRQAWDVWYTDLREHELAHQRVSSAAAIETWLKRRVAGIRYLERTFPAGKQLGDREGQAAIRAELTEIYNHALERIRDKNEELDQRTAHGRINFRWDEFLRGYF